MPITKFDILDFFYDCVFEPLGFHAIPIPLPKPANGHALKMKGLVQTNSYSCVATAGYSVLKYLNPDTPVALRKFMKLVGESTEGASDAQLKRALRRCEVSTRAIDPRNSKEIKKWLGKNIPIITAILRPSGMWHCVVIYGYAKLDRKNYYLVANNVENLWRNSYMPVKSFRSSVDDEKGSAFACFIKGKTFI